MPNLIGNIADRFNERTEAALTRAGMVHSQDPFARVVVRDVQPPNLPAPVNQTLNMPTGSGSLSARNVGNSSNIALEPDVYNQAMKRMVSIDDFVGEEVFTMLGEIEEICSTIFQVPETIERIRNVCSEVKRCLGPFRGVTDDVVINTRQYLNAMSNADWGNTGQIAVSHMGVNNAIQVARTTIDRQASSMDRTSTTYKHRADRLEQEAEREQRRVDSLEAQISAAMTNV